MFKFKNAYFYFLLTCCALCTSAEETVLSTSLTRIWGPGLQPDVYRLPARYFFIEAIDNNNNSMKFPQKSQLAVTVKGVAHNGMQCRVWTDILDKNDGSYIVRYKLYEMCSDVTIVVMYDEEHVAQSPYLITGIVYPEDCDCASGNLEEMLSSWDCGAVPQQLTDDLHIFKKINWDDIRQKVIRQYNNPGAISLCHYVIKDNAVYNKCYGQHVGFKTFMDSMLLSLARKVNLPDMEFFVNLGDYPLVHGVHNEVVPIFSWCGSTDSFDIVMPTYEISDSTLENMGKVMLDILSVQGNANTDWDKRIPRLFWRGRDSNANRLKLIKIARENPDLFNASLTNFFFYRDVQDVYGPKTEHISFFKFFDYKYQINIDGTVAAYRMPYLLAGQSTVFKPDSKYYEHFYHLLTPNVHYVPVNEDLSNLVDKVNWAINNEDAARKIAITGRNFANKHLLPVNVYCYHAFLLNEFSKRLENTIAVLEGMEKVEQPEQKSPCTCKTNKKDEL